MHLNNITHENGPLSHAAVYMCVATVLIGYTVGRTVHMGDNLDANVAY